jgi:glycosyltransferase involved in cell wall biosynthesis
LSQSRKILIVTHVFPPAGGVPVQRPLSFAKYLPDSGFEVHVLTTRNGAAPVHDPGLLRHVPPAVKVHRTFTPEVPFGARKKVWSWISPTRNADAAPAARSAGSGWKSWLSQAARRILSPDPEVVWVPFAVRRGTRLIERYGIGTILLTAPPFSVFLTGLALKRKFPHLTMVSDFRDEWLNFYLSTFEFHSSPQIRARAAETERATVESSSLVISVTPSIVDQIRERYPHLDANRFAHVPNGYDPDAFRDFRPRPHSTDKIVVTFTGTVYRSSSPRFYLDALDALPAAVRSRFETRFIGRVAGEERASLENRKSVVRTLGFMPQSEAFRALEETDFLLLTMTDASSLTGKLFEYLATGKPILAFAPTGGEIDAILKETGAGWCTDPFDPAAVERTLLAAASPEGPGLKPDRAAIERYQRPKIAAELARLIQERAQ